jgi:hypothetical protein
MMMMMMMMTFSATGEFCYVVTSDKHIRLE